MKRIFRFVLVVILLLTSLYVVFYYWSASEIEDLRSLSSVLLTAIVIYIAVQLIKRFVRKKIAWYDWFYYVGLVAVLLPLMTFTASGNWIFDVTKYGSFFLVFPPFVELLELIGTKKK